MTGSSPFHDGVDTGYDSYRTLWWSRWPITGPPEYLGSAERFQEVVAGLVASGVIADGRTSTGTCGRPTTCRRWSSVSPTSAPRWTTPCCTRPWCAPWCACWPPGRAGEPCPQPRPELLRAARWRAARHGIGGELFDPVRGALVDAPVAVRRLLAELEDDLRGRDEWTVGRAGGRGSSPGHVGHAAAADLAADRGPAGGRRRHRPRGTAGPAEPVVRPGLRSGGEEPQRDRLVPALLQDEDLQLVQGVREQEAVDHGQLGPVGRCTS